MKPRLWLAAAAAGLTLGSPAWGQTLERSPYLQQSTPSSVILVWTTTQSSESVVRYGSSPTSLTQTTTAAAGTQHEVKITGLTPNTRYYYSVGTSGVTLAGGDSDHWFETAPTAGTAKKFRAWVVGDSGTGGTPQANVRNAMLAHVGRYRPHLFLHLGDMAYNTGTTSEFTTRFFGVYPTVLRNTVTWPTLGNHEGATSDSGTQTGPYYTAYVLPKGGEAGGLPSGTEAYYAFDFANVHFIVLDSHDTDRSPNGAMLTWAKNDIAATTQPWVVAFWHHPPYTKGSHDSDTETQLRQMRENALPILEAGGVDLVLAGHSHIYERSYLIDGAYETPSTATGKIKDSGDGKPLGSGPYQKPATTTANAGAVYVVAGHGGASISGPANHPLMYFSEKQHGSCILDVQDNRLSLFNIRHDGQITDRFTLVKGNALVIAEPDGGETLEPGEAFDIRWATVGTIPQVDLAYSANDGSSWSTIATAIANTGQFTWTVPNVTTDRALVRVRSTAQTSIEDESNAGFIIGNVGPQTVIPFGDEWKYLDQGPDPGPAVTTAAFDDSGWASGKAELGYGDGDEATVIYQGSPNIATAYFRKTITLQGAIESAALEVIHDDGVAVFINGSEVLSKYTAGLEFGTYASAASQDNELSSAPVPSSVFVSGQNVVTALVKQANATSSDLSFDLKLELTFEPSSPDAGAGGAAGSGSGAASGTGGSGAGSSSGGAGNTSAAAGAAGAKGGSDSGCGCRTRESGGAGAPLLLLLTAVGAARRRRRDGIR